MPATRVRLSWLQALTVLLLFTGYAAYYVCRSNLSVAMPLLIDELRQSGMSGDDALVRLGSIASAGVLAYALGKLLLTAIVDVWGGRRSFTFGLAGAVLWTLMFASGSSVPWFTIAWVGNRLTQSIGWAGLVKVSSNWFSRSSYGTVMGLLSISYLVGDAATRGGMGVLIARGYSWRALFHVAAAVASVVLAANLLFLRDSRTELGFEEPEVNPFNLFAGENTRPRGVWALVGPLLRNPGFLVVCLLSLGTTIVRETFNTWTPVYLHDFFGYDAARSASLSAVFPAVGAVSVLITGWLSDQAGVTARAGIMILGLAATAGTLLVLASMPQASGAMLPLVLVGTVAFALLGPYAYLAGACALDFGGKYAGAVSSGLIDAAGYFGGVLAGDTVARVSVSFGWRGVFVALAIISALSALVAAYLFVYQRSLERSRDRLITTN